MAAPLAARGAVPGCRRRRSIGRRGGSRLPPRGPWGGARRAIFRALYKRASGRAAAVECGAVRGGAAPWLGRCCPCRPLNRCRRKAGWRLGAAPLPAAGTGGDGREKGRAVVPTEQPLALESQGAEGGHTGKSTVFLLSHRWLGENVQLMRVLEGGRVGIYPEQEQAV